MVAGRLDHKVPKPHVSLFMVAGRLDHKVPKPHVSFRCSKRAGAPKGQKQFSGTSQPTAGTQTGGLPRVMQGHPAYITDNDLPGCAGARRLCSERWRERLCGPRTTQLNKLARSLGLGRLK
jgi:hypothetical protein